MTAAEMQSIMKKMQGVMNTLKNKMPKKMSKKSAGNFKKFMGSR